MSLSPDSFAPIIGFGTRVRKSPFFDATRRYGAKAFTVYNHMYMPLWYEDPTADYWKLVNDVTLWDVSAQRQVEITGPDAAKFVQYLTPRRLTECAVGQCKYVLLTDENGGLINDPVLLKLGENHFWLSLADSDVLLWTKAIAAHTEMDVHITEPDVSPLQLQGPHAFDVMVTLVGDWPGNLGYFWFQEHDLDGIPLVISRTGWSGQRGFEIYLRDGSMGDLLWERIMEAGRAFGIAPAAPSQIERIEAGMLSYATDMTLENNPFEINLGKLCDLDMQADFMGKEALKRIKQEGVQQRLVGLEVGGGPMIEFNADHWRIMDGEEPVGVVTSSVYSPRLDKNLALGYVSVGCSDAGTELGMEAPWGLAPCTVSPLPFLKPNRKS